MKTRIHSRLTPLGWFTCVGGGLLLTTAFLLDHAYAVLLGCMLFGACIFSLLLGRRQLHRIESRWLIPAAPHAGQYNTIGAEFNSDKASAPFSLLAYEPRSEQSQIVSSVPGSQIDQSRITWPIFFPQRGHIALPPLQIASTLPFGLINSRCEHSSIARLIVLPAIGQLRKELHISLEHWLHQQRLPTPNGTDELVRLRPYQHGDSPRLVHWRASARNRQLIVSVRSDISDMHLALVVDCWSKQTNSRRFERLISMAATLVDHAHRHGWSISLHGYFAPPNGLFDSRQTLMEALALLKNRTEDPVADYIPNQQSCLVLTLREDLAEHIDSPHCKIMQLTDLESHIALARERR